MDSTRLGVGTDVSFAKILIVDDEAPVRRVLERMLKGRCEAVVQAASVAEALAALEAGGIDLVITDIRLGGESGVDVARAAAMRHPAPPVVAMSGQADPSDGLELGKAGVTAFVAKPFTVEEMLGVVEGLRTPRSFELDAVVRRVVGAWPMPEVLDAVRRAMVYEALAKTAGNKAQAAQLLGISRQHLQKILARGRV